MSRLYSFIFFKQPDEKYPIAVDFADALDTAETITSKTLTAYDAELVDVTGTIIDSSEISGDTIKAVVKSGTDGIKYKITFKASTSDGNTYEQDIAMKVGDL